jgi:bifunctional non-homologous end joining protein LigD
VVDAQTGTTKEELVGYYASVSQLMLVHLAGRPVSLVRAPAGIGGELFFQKHAETAKLAGLRRFPVEIHPRHPPMLEVATAQALLSTAQWNVIEYHTQNALGVHYTTPDRMIFDLDPGEGVGWGEIQEAAQLVRAMLEHLGLTPFLKTSGGKGLHLDVPIEPMYGWDLVKDLSKAIVVHMAAILPARFSAKSGAANRKKRIFIDYLRNGKGATTACAWSARARPGLGISVPVNWDELQGLKGGDHWTVASVDERLITGNSPWNDYTAAAANINEALEMLEMPRRALVVSSGTKRSRR